MKKTTTLEALFQFSPNTKATQAVAGQLNANFDIKQGFGISKWHNRFSSFVYSKKGWHVMHLPDQVESQKWFHAVLVKNNTEVSFYLNSKLQNTIPNTGNALFANLSPFTIGTYLEKGLQEDLYMMYGKIHHVKLSPTAYNPTQISKAYAAAQKRIANNFVNTDAKAQSKSMIYKYLFLLIPLPWTLPRFTSHS